MIIRNVCSSFNISLDQIYTITTDNGTNMLKAVKILSSEYGNCEILEQDQNEDNENNDIDCNTYLESEENEEGNEYETNDDVSNILEKIETEDLNSNFQNNVITGKRFLKF